jgi:hypothetical protein
VAGTAEHAEGLGTGASRFIEEHGPPRAKDNQRFDWPAPAAEVSVNLKIDVQRVGLDLCKCGLGTAHWTRIQGPGHEQCKLTRLYFLLPRCRFAAF